jgi:hypothetical protein
MVNNSINIKKRIITSHHNSLNTKKGDNDIWCWKSRSWLATCTHVWQGQPLNGISIFQSKSHVKTSIQGHFEGTNLRLSFNIKHKPSWSTTFKDLRVWFRFMVFNAIFNNISAISWQSVFFVDETRAPWENHRPVASHWQTVSRIVVSSTHRHEQVSNSQL